MIRKLSLRCTIATGMMVAWVGCTDLPTEPADTGDMRVRGITLSDWTATGYGSMAARAEIDRIGLIGANTLALVITAYQDNASSSAIHIDAEKTPTQGAVATAVSRARSAGAGGLRVVFKPHIDRYDGEWRGRISPRDVDAWFASYGSFIRDWAILAEALGVEQFIVGTELAGTLGHESRWRNVIASVRAVYSGELIYAASWDEAAIVPFWDALDCVGINFYAPVTARTETGRFEALSGWQSWLDRMRLIHKQAGRDVLLTEIGYRSVDGAGMRPYDFESSADIDMDEQAHLYWAALQAAGDKPWIRGMYWWNWLVGASAQQALKDYTPKDKPAERELRDAWTE